MASLRTSVTRSCRRTRLPLPAWQQLLCNQFQSLQLANQHSSRRALTTESNRNSDGSANQYQKFLDSTDDDFGDINPESANSRTSIATTITRAGNDESHLQLALPRLPQHARVVPVSPAYFSRQTRFAEAFVELIRLDRKYAHLPKTPPEQQERAAWKTLEDFKLGVGEPISASDYSRCIRLVKNLYRIHPMLHNDAIKGAIMTFKRDIKPGVNQAKPIPVDKFGRAVGVGRRKSSVARAWVVEGTGEIRVNGKNIVQAFSRVHDRESALFALHATGRMDKYNVWALIDGGGTTGQAEAMTLAVAKALIAHEPALKPALRRAGCVTRDHRAVERKKPGHVKARKSPTWVKR